MKTLEIGSVKLGEGLPKICVPLTGETWDQLIEEAKEVSQLPCDMIEWRADYMLAHLKTFPFPMVRDTMKGLAAQLRTIIKVPMIFTIRTESEGGQVKISEKAYYKLNEVMVDAGMEVIDIEAFEGPGQVNEEAIRDFVAYAHEYNSHVLLSSHDFEKTPDLQEMLTRFFVMQDLDADIMKLAVMPNSDEDVMNLLEAAVFMRDGYGKIPFVVIGMGELGINTRICGGQFGSAITFAAGKNASAPGQIGAATLKGMMEQYYNQKES